MDNGQYFHNFINKHTAFGILILIVGCFLAGYFVGQNSKGKASLITGDRKINSVRNY